VKKSVLLRTCAAVALPLAATFVAPSAAYAQETSATVQGRVTSNGAPVPNAQVVIVHEPSNTTSRTTSDANGNFSSSGLRVGGPFRVEVSAPNFEGVRVTGVNLSAGEPLDVPVELAAAGAATTGASSQEVVVTGTRAREQSTGPITALTRTQIEGVASVNRDIRDLARRDPFVTQDLTNARVIEVAGTNGRFNRFSVDGAQFNDDFGLNNGGLPTSRGPVPFDAIEQFSVKVAPFDIAEGDFQGGAINVILRSGGNRFRGNGFFAYSDDSLTGDRVEGQQINLEFKSKQYGGLLSGPIIKDRLFFMGAFEATNESDPFDDGVGPGFANQVPNISLAQIGQVTNISNSVYGYDPLGLISNANEKDRKFVGKFDLNITEGHRASLTLVRNRGTQQFQQNTFLTPVFAIGLQSNGYELQETVNSGTLQVNSDWTDKFSTELRASRRNYVREQTPFGGRDFAQFEVCLDPNSVNQGSNSATSCGSARVFFGPDVSRQTNDLETTNTSVDLTARFDAGAHNLRALFGYTKIDTFNLFLQRSLGDVYFDSIADFQARRASRIRLGGAVPSLNPADAAASFSTTNLTFGVQDDWQVNDQLQINAGLRYDLFVSNDVPPNNPNFNARYGFTNRTTFDNKGLWQPRIGFNWTPADRVIIRGGTGVFGGGTPDVYVSNSFSNTGLLTNSIDITRANCTASGLTCGALDNVSGRTFPSSVTNFLANNVGSLAIAPVNAIDPALDIASTWRSSLSVNYRADLGSFLGDGWFIGADLLYGNTLSAYVVTDLRSVPIGTLPDGRVRYGALNNIGGTNQDLLLTDTSKGRSIIGVVRFDKRFDNGFGINASYTRSSIKDVSSLTSSTASSNYGNNAFFDGNQPAYGRSVYEIKHQVKFGVDFRRKILGDNFTRVSLFGEARSGRPYSLTALDRGTGRLPVYGTVGNGGRVLLYVPETSDPRVVFGSNTTNGVTQTAAQAEALFNQLVTDLDIERYRGRVVPKNSQTSPKFVKIDLHLSQELPSPFISGAKFELFGDIENVLNLINNNWGELRQVSFPYTAPLVDVTCATTVGTSCTQYRYSNVQSPLQTLNSRQSLYQIRVGARFRF
jgi:hypothetical protein